MIGNCLQRDGNRAVPTIPFNNLERPPRSAIAPDRSNWSVTANDLDNKIDETSFYVALSEENELAKLPLRKNRFAV
jgi:hypothetical protein